MKSIKCPFCSFESNEGSFKLLREPWKFRFYTVKRLECPRCRGIFNLYSGVSSKEKASTFVIKVKPKAKKI